MRRTLRRQVDNLCLNRQGNLVEIKRSSVRQVGEECYLIWGKLGHEAWLPVNMQVLQSGEQCSPDSILVFPGGRQQRGWNSGSDSVLSDATAWLGDQHLGFWRTPRPILEAARPTYLGHLSDRG